MLVIIEMLTMNDSMLLNAILLRLQNLFANISPKKMCNSCRTAIVMNAAYAFLMYVNY